MEELQDKVDRVPQGKYMVPTDDISHIAGHRCPSPERAVFPVCVCVPVLSMCVYINMWACVTCVNMGLCVCVCFWPRADTQMKVSGEEQPSDEERRHEVSLD